MKSLLLLAILSLSACGLVSKKSVDPVVKLHGTVHKPYCGGAKPSPDVAAGYYESMKHVSFKLYKGTEYSSSSEFVMDVNLDEGGNAELNLLPGDYLMMRSDKLLTVDEFISKNGPVEEKLYEMKERSCFEDWMRTVDLKFTVNGDTLIEFREKAKCWVGTNPCIRYVGPPAP